MTPRLEQVEPDPWPCLYRTAFTVTLGQRLQRVREGKRLTQAQAIRKVQRPRGGTYSRGLLSRIEGGYANSPLYVYLQLAEAYDLDPARLLGPEEAEKDVGEAEMAMIRFLRRLGIPPDEVMARVVGRR